MRVIKFNTANKPKFVTEDWLLDDRRTGTQIKGWWIVTGKDEDYVRIENGDYIITVDGIHSIIRSTDYVALEEYENKVKRAIGEEALNIMFSRLKDMSVTNAARADIVNRLLSTVVALNMGEIRGARILCNNTPTGGSLTGNIKNAVLAIIDEQITKL